eukprot:TRINITY_DN12445_c0_g1_i1.p1 TRINITY_DN12445_c0_g1~~TRINITY_DN12445_c0_g1_i1.p1  ORF type:complete len:126 (-),score=12.58 TRINITY_DN12445_c0_g1_i1:131-508(-)
MQDCRAAAGDGNRLLGKLIELVTNKLKEKPSLLSQSDILDLNSQLQQLLAQIEQLTRQCIYQNQSNGDEEGDDDMGVSQEQLREDVKLLEQQVMEKQQILEGLIPQIRKFSSMLCITELDPQQFK